jgi:hypothetical protein
MFFNRRANVVASILLVIMTLVSVAVYTTYTIQSGEKKQNLEEFESGVVVRKNIVFGLNDFIFSDSYTFGTDGGLWYCNYPFPASLDQINASLSSIIKKQVDLYLTKLEEEFPNVEVISGPNISLITGELDNLDNNSLVVNVDNFVVEITENNSIRRMNLSKKEGFYFRTWQFYKVFYEWLGSDADGIIQGIYTSLFDNPQKQCQAYECTCVSEPGEILINGTDLEKMMLNFEEVEKSLNASISELNKMFAGSGIFCRINLSNNSRIENYVNRTQEHTDMCEHPYTKYVYPPEDNSTEFNAVNENDPRSQPLKECNIGGALINLGNDNKIKIQSSSHPPDNYFNFSYSEKRDLPRNVTVTYDNSPMVERIGVSTHLNLLFSVECTDSEVSIDTAKGFEPYRTKIELGVNLVRTCQPPKKSYYTNDICQIFVGVGIGEGMGAGEGSGTGKPPTGGGGGRGM